MPKTCIILNPWSGRGNGKQQRPALEAALRKYEVDYTIVETHARGGGIELAYQALDRGYEQIVAAGGDGTINEVVNGLMGSRAQGGRVAQLGIIPVGTGSDFVKVLDGVQANDLEGAARRLAAGKTRFVDVGLANERYFLNAIGMGLDAQVAYETTKLPNIKGVAVYLVGIIRALANYKSYPMTIRYDDHELKRRMLFTSVANGRCQGGAFWLTPQAEIDDGVLDLCMVEKMRLPSIIRHIPTLMEGKHTSLKWVTMGQARRITIDSNGPMPFATDGEVIATDVSHVEIEIIPKALELIV
jgi:diacylglycerol kinase (ATP)